LIDGFFRRIDSPWQLFGAELKQGLSVFFPPNKFRSQALPLFLAVWNIHAPLKKGGNTASARIKETGISWRELKTAGNIGLPPGIAGDFLNIIKVSRVQLKNA
jgi:hypothetical protein